MVKNRNIIACIPARMGSSRLQNKLTQDIGGKPIIQHVYERAVSTGLFSKVYIVLDDAMNDFVTFTDDKILTGSQHTSGSSRVCEAIANIECDFVVNIQGDEPFISLTMLEKLVNALDKKEITTLCFKMTETSSVFDENKVKIVRDHQDYAMYFSRSPIPFMRGVDRDIWVQKADYFEHVGIYAFHRSVLLDLYPNSRTELEKTESLEQLSWLYQGYKIKCIEINETTISIDTEEDLEFARTFFDK